MSVTNFVEQYEDRYQDTFHKVQVAPKFANYRLEAGLKRGDTVHRFAIDISDVKVRTITPLVDRTVDPITNTDETLTIDQYKGATFPVSQWEDTLHGNPDLGLLYGKEVGILVSEYLDATILSEVQNAETTFDDGDLTATSSSGTPLSLAVSDVPTMVTRAKAKLNTKKVRGGNKMWIVDDYILATMTEHQIGRDTSMADSFWKNGMSGSILGDDVAVSDNLTGEAVLALATQPTANDTVSIAGVTFTFVASPASAGDVDLGSDVDETRANLAAAINAGSGAGSDYIELSSDDRATLDALRIAATNDDTADTLTIVGTGAGRLSVSETLTDGTDEWSKNFIHCIYGQRGAIDVVVAEEVNMKMREEPKQDTMNIFNDLIFGVKTFADGAKKMLDVQIDAS